MSSLTPKIFIKHIIKILRGSELVLNNIMPLLSADVSGIEVDTSTTVVDGVTNLADSISKNGALIVIGAAFIVFSILILLMFIKINSDMFKNIVNQINQKNDENSEITKKLLDHFLDEEEKEKEKEKDEEDNEEEPKKHHAKDLVGLYIDYTTAFKGESKSVINAIRCDRVAVYVFHNGNQTLYGLPFIKMSCVYEDTMKGNMTMRSKAHMNLPLHLFNDFIQALYRDGIFAGNIDDVEIHDGSIREFLSFSDAKSVFMRAIKKEDGSLAGFTVCEFTEPVDYTDKEKFMTINNKVKEMNDAIKYIVTDDEFSKKYEQHN